MAQQSEFIHFRADPKLLAKLEAFAKTQPKKLSLAQAARILLETSLSNDPKTAILEAAFKASKIAADELAQSLPARIAEALCE